MVFGVEDETKRKIGATVRLNELKKGNENLLNWLTRMLEPTLLVEFLDFEDQGKQFAVITIEPSYDRPVRFAGVEYIRVGEM